MAPIVVAAHLTTSGNDARQKVVAQLTQAMSYAKEQEPGVTKYCIMVPEDELDETSIYVVEEYTDKAALDSHMVAPPVVALLELFSSDPTLLSGAPTIFNLEFVEGFTRPEVVGKSPYVVFGVLDYKPGTVEQALAGWRKVATETQKNEPDTLSYNILADPANKDSVKTIEVYESKEFLWETHAKSQAVTQNKESDQDRRAGLKHAFLKVIAGYLYKKGQS